MSFVEHRRAAHRHHDCHRRAFDGVVNRTKLLNYLLLIGEDD